MYPADLFSTRWTTTAAAPASSSESGDFDFGLPRASSPTTLVASASRIFRGGRLLPSGAADQEYGGDPVVPVPPVVGASSPPSSTLTRSPCSGAGRPERGAASPAAPWKVLMGFLRVMPLCRQVVRALAPRHRPRPEQDRPTSSSAAASAAPDMAVHDAILYCKKSSGQN